MIQNKIGRNHRMGVGTTATVIAAFLLLTGCQDGTYLGGLVRAGDPPLPGERIAILTDEDLLTPDEVIADEAVELPTPRIETEWPQQGGSATHTMAHGIISAQPQEIWTADIGEGSDDEAFLLSGPVVANGVIYTIDTDSMVSAFDAATGAEFWRAETEVKGERNRSWGGGLAIGDGRIYVTTGYGDVIALDVGSGEQIWRRTVSGPMRSSPTFQDERLFVITKDNRLHALSASTGEVLWEHEGESGGAGLTGASSPAVFGDVVVAAYSSNEIFALDVADGSEFWTDSLTSARRVGGDSNITAGRRQLPSRQANDCGKSILVQSPNRGWPVTMCSSRQTRARSRQLKLAADLYAG
jgi:hypothetical protein